MSSSLQLCATHFSRGGENFWLRAWIYLSHALVGLSLYVSFWKFAPHHMRADTDEKSFAHFQYRLDFHKLHKPWIFPWLDILTLSIFRSEIFFIITLIWSNTPPNDQQTPKFRRIVYRYKNAVLFTKTVINITLRTMFIPQVTAKSF